MSKRRSLLAIYAHPDDEVLGPGGTLARSAAEGTRVVLVVATRGEAGEIQRPGTATPATLSQVRTEELYCSARALGVSEVFFLGYRDSGMAGTVENDHPRAFINAPAHEVVSQIVSIIRREQPQVLLTFEPYGGYGHPDHVAINRHTVAAFHAAGEEGAFPGQGPPWRPSRLFYPLLPASLFQEIKDRVAAAGGDTTGYDELIAERATHEDAWPEDAIHAVLDVSAYVDQKWAAWHCHRTQFGPNSRFRRLPAAEMKELLSTEYFGLAKPEASRSLHLTGLFQGLD